MKQIKEAIDIKELLKQVGMELPTELPEFGASIEYKDGVLQMKGYYDEEGFAKIEVSESQVKAWLFQLQAAMILYEDALKEQLQNLQKGLFS